MSSPSNIYLLSQNKVLLELQAEIESKKLTLEMSSKDTDAKVSKTEIFYLKKSSRSTVYSS